jgi:Leucine-rich repeat (LRR) protein
MNLDSDIAKINQLLNSSDGKNHLIACQLIKGNKTFVKAFANEVSIHKFVVSLQPEKNELAFLLMKQDKELAKIIKERYWPLVEFAGGKNINSLRTVGNRIRRIEKKWSINLSFKGWKIEQPFDSYTASLPIRDIRMIYKRTPKLPFFLSKLPQLESLMVGKCQLENLPDYWDNFPNLTNLNLSSSKLTSLPRSMGQLKKLKRLSLTSNRFEEVPVAISSLTQLNSLSVDLGKKISILPEWIGNLTQLTFLSFSESQISELPASIGKLKDLKYLSIFRTPLNKKHPLTHSENGKKEHVQAYINKVLNNQNKES